jgi:hypothetical protein
MPDKLVPSSDDTGAIRRFRDMGDGTFAEVVSTAAGAAGAAGYPAGAVPVAAVASGANQINTATLPAAVGKTTYVAGIEMSAGGATGAGLQAATLAGALGGTFSWVVEVPSASGSQALKPISVTFNPPLPASAANTAISFSLAALGAGNVSAQVSIRGFQL